MPGGGVRLLHSTSGREVATPQEIADGPNQATVLAAGRMPGAATKLCIPPRENRLVAAGGGRLAAWSVDAGYPEVSLRTLLLPVWYENYPAAAHAWETTGH